MKRVEHLRIGMGGVALGGTSMLKRLVVYNWIVLGTQLQKARSC